MSTETCMTSFAGGALSDSERFTNLTPVQLEQFRNRFDMPEMFLSANGNIICLSLKYN